MNNEALSRRSRAPASSGFILVTVVLILTLLAIFIPVLVRMSTTDSRWSVRRSQIDEAYTVAEAGLDRGSWKLGESESVWQAALAGTAVTEYNYDRTWTDLDSAYRYKIKFSSGPGPTEVRVRCKVQAVRAPTMVRTLEGVYTRNFVEALVMQTDFTGSTDKFPRVHWGAVKSYAALNVNSNVAMPNYPRKLARNGIQGRDTTPDDYNSDRQEYWAYDKNIGDPPVIDYEYYRAKAKASSLPDTTANNGKLRMRHNPAPAATLVKSTPTLGTAYFLCADNWEGAGQDHGIDFDASGGGNHYTFINSTTVVFIETSSNTCRSFIHSEIFLDIEAFIVAGPNNNLNFRPDESAAFAATIPVNANMEYLHSAASATWMAGGIGSMDNIWHGSRYPYNISNNIGFHGFLHVQDGELNVDENSHDVKVIGIVYAKQLKIETNPKFFYVYFDDAVASKLKVVYTPIRRRLYREDKADTVW